MRVRIDRVRRTTVLRYISRRGFSGLAAGAAGLFLLAACTPAAAPSPTTAAKPAATAAPAPKTEAQPAAKAETKPGPSPAAKAEAKPAAKASPEAREGSTPLPLSDADRQKAADFYRGKTI